MNRKSSLYVLLLAGALGVIAPASAAPAPVAPAMRASPAPGAAVQAKALELARELRLGTSFKAGMRMVVQRQGASSPLIDFILAQDDAELDRLFGAALATRLQPRDLDAALVFHRTATGRKIVAAQLAGLGQPTPPLNLTEAEQAEAMAYYSTPSAQALKQVTSDRSMYDEVSAALRAKQSAQR